MTPPDDEPEFRKGLLGILMAGDACALIDNLAKPVKSAALCAAITSPTYRDRLMGVNSTVTVSTAVTLILTGNGLQFVGDLTTRALLIGIDPQLERPEERQFQRNLPAYIAEHRSELLAATLAIPLAYVAAGEPKLTAPHSRFAEWDRLVRRRCCGSASPIPWKRKPSCAPRTPSAKTCSVCCTCGRPPLAKSLRPSQ
jgi:hypothetical protein